MHGRKRRDGSRLDAGCGMAENSIKKGIADAVASGFLIVEVDTRDLEYIRKFYAPRMRTGVRPMKFVQARPDRKLTGGQRRPRPADIDPGPSTGDASILKN